jgi:O-antigen/teichoic acid export membrane protein/SAM-dependent methyltransferase
MGAEAPGAGPDLGRSAVRSTLYGVGGSLGIKALQFLRAVVIARLLVPAEVGRFALVVVALGAVESTTQPGLEGAIVQARSLGPRALPSVWTVRVLRGLALFGLVFALAPAIAGALRAPDVVPLLRWVAAASLLRSFYGLGPLLRVRRVDLAPSIRLQVAGEAAETVVAVAAVAALRSASGLVVARLVAVACEVAGSYLVPGFRPGLALAWRDLRPLVRTGRWFFLSGLLTYLSTSADDLLVGRLAGTRPLGLYRVAYRIAYLPTTETSLVAGRAAFPAFARSHEASPERARAAFRRYVALAAGLAAPAAAVIAATAPDLVRVVLGPAWTEAAGPLAIMAAAGFLHAVVGTGGAFFAGAGRPQLDTAIQTVRTVVLLGTLPALLAAHGVTGAAVASLASVAAAVPVWAHGVSRLGLDLLGTARAVATRLPAAAAAGAAAGAVVRLVAGPAASLAGSLAAAAAVWLAAVVGLDRGLRRELAWVLTRLLATSRLPSVRYFEAAAERYAAAYGEDSAGGLALRQRRRQAAELLRGVSGDVLDVGCGPGVLMEEVRALGCRYVGLDGSPAMIRLARRESAGQPGVHLAVGDAGALPHPEASFDAVVALGLVDRLPDSERALAEMGRVLRPGGRLVVSFPNASSPAAAWRSYAFLPLVAATKRLAAAVRRRPVASDLASPARLWTRAEATRLLERIGPVDTCRYFNFTPLPAPLDELLPGLAGRLAARLARSREHHAPRLAMGFVLRAVKPPVPEPAEPVPAGARGAGRLLDDPRPPEGPAWR